MSNLACNPSGGRTLNLLGGHFGLRSAAAAFGRCSAAASSNPLAPADFVPGIGVAVVRKKTGPRYFFSGFLNSFYPGAWPLFFFRLPYFFCSIPHRLFCFRFLYFFFGTLQNPSSYFLFGFLIFC